MTFLMYLDSVPLVKIEPQGPAPYAQPMSFEIFSTYCTNIAMRSVQSPKVFERVLSSTLNFSEPHSMAHMVAAVQA